MFNDKEFDKQFNATRRIAIAGMVITGAFSVGVIVFLGWVVVQLMKWGGVI